MNARRRDPGSTTTAYRNLLKGDDLTVGPTRRRTGLGLVALFALLVLVSWLLAYWA